MRTTIKIDDELLAEAKAHAAKTGKTLNAVVEDALRESFARRRQVKQQRRVELRTFRGSRLQAGVDSNHNAVVLDLAEGIER